MSTLQSHLDVWDPAAVHAAKPADTCTAVGAEDAPQPLAAAEEGEGDGPASAFSFTLAVCWLCLFCDYLLLTIAIPIFPELKECRDSDFLTGVLFSAKAVMQIACSPIVSCYVDKYTLQLLLGGMLVEGGATVIFALTDSYALWFVGRATQGIASAAILTAAFAYLQHAYTDDKLRGEAMAAATTGIITGVMAGPPIGGLLYSAWKPAPFVLATSLCGLAAFGVIVLRGRRTTAAALAAGGAKQDHADTSVVESSNGDGMVRRLLGDRHVAATLGALLIANAAISCLEASIGNYLKDDLGMTVTQTGLMYMTTAGPSVLASGFAGLIGNRLGRWRTMCLGLVLQGAFYTLGPKDVLGLEVASLVGLGLGMGLVDGVAPALLGTLSDRRFGGTGVIYAVSTAAIQAGFMVGPVAGGAIMEVFGFWVMSIVLGTIVAVYAVVVALVFRNGLGPSVAAAGEVVSP